MPLFFIRPYSPDLNPIELCWRETRKEVTHNTYFKSLEILKDSLENYFNTYSIENNKIKNLCNWNWK